MKPYTPSFVCPYCGVDIQAKILDMNTVLSHAYLPSCTCEESQKEQERLHRLQMERRKKARRK